MIPSVAGSCSLFQALSVSTKKGTYVFPDPVKSIEVPECPSTAYWGMRVAPFRTCIDFKLWDKK